MGVLKTVSVTKTIAAAENYTANDVVSNSATGDAGTPFTFTNAVIHSGKPCYFTGAKAQCSEDAVVWRLRLHLFNALPLAAEVEMDDNIAFNIKTAAGAAKYAGYIDLPAMIDLGALPAYAQADQINFMVDPANGSDLYGVLQTLDNESNEAAGMTITIQLHLED
jgi:hypothetical protein